MRKGQISKNNGCASTLGIILALFFGGVILYALFSTSKEMLSRGNAFGSVVSLGVLGAIGYVGYKTIIAPRRAKNTIKGFEEKPLSIKLKTAFGELILNNPFRGIFIVGSAGSGKSESFAVPLINQFIKKDFAGIVYDFKFPALAQEVEYFKNAHRSDLSHFYLNFNEPTRSHRVNPIQPDYVPNSSYAREYASAIIANLLKESTKKPDYWTRSATDLLTACIWYLREEHPHICDLPHVFALITSNDRALLQVLQGNNFTAQATMNMYNAMQRGADSQVSGVVGTLQGAIAQINTPELMYIFSGNDFSLDLNAPGKKSILTVGSYPTLVNTFSPLCSLVITVATKLMNQPHKAPSFVLLDEAPTCYVPNLEVLPNTGRSNKVATVVMCQDLAQLVDGYGQEKADVLFASCNNHFYGRVSSSKTSEILSRQFGKQDVTYVSSGQSRKTGDILTRHRSESESVQERDIYKPSVFLNLQVGQFAGQTVESNRSIFLSQFGYIKRDSEGALKPKATTADIHAPYNQARHDINRILSKYTEQREYHKDKSILKETDKNVFKDFKF